MTTLCLHASSERLTLYFYGELPAGERRAFDEHLAGCEACSSAVAEMHALRSALTPRKAPSRPPADWDAFMQRLLQRIDAPDERHQAGNGIRRVGMSPALAAAAALVLAVGTGLLWQRAILGPPAGPVAMGQPAISDPALEAAAARHFERAKLVVLGIAMKDPALTTASDWEYERHLAGSLLPETRLFRLSAVDRGDARLASLLGDLESVLLQASMTTDAESSELQRLQRVIRRRDLLVRMDLREL
jgi:hypothetical protein